MSDTLREALEKTAREWLTNGVCGSEAYGDVVALLDEHPDSSTTEWGVQFQEAIVRTDSKAPQLERAKADGRAVSRQVTPWERAK